MAGKSARKVAKRSGATASKPKTRTGSAAARPMETKKKSARSPRAPTAPARNNAALHKRAAKPAKEVYYFVVASANARISTSKPPAAQRVETAGSFDDVKDKAVDHLIELIDELEQGLWALKRSQDYTQYQALVAGQ